MRKPLTDVAGINATLMTFEQLLIFITYECGEYAIEDFLKKRYEFPLLHDEYGETLDKKEEM